MPRGHRPAPEILQVEHLPVPLYRRTPLYRRIWAVISGSVLSLVLGALLALLIGAGAIYFVTTLTGLLKK